MRFELVMIAALGLSAVSMGRAEPATRPAATRPTATRPVQFTGGHDTDPRDRGRPVVLVAAGLGVAPDVFREAFSHVRPAPGGERPTESRVRENKKALLDALGKHGVTNDRLDEVSNYYRYRPQEGEVWTRRDAKAYATLGPDGKVMGVVVTDAGAGYSSEPEVRVEGKSVPAKVTVAFGKDLERNGSISKVEVSR